MVLSTHSKRTLGHETFIGNTEMFFTMTVNLVSLQIFSCPFTKRSQFSKGEDVFMPQAIQTPTEHDAFLREVCLSFPV